MHTSITNHINSFLTDTEQPEEHMLLLNKYDERKLKEFIPVKDATYYNPKQNMIKNDTRFQQQLFWMIKNGLKAEIEIFHLILKYYKPRLIRQN